jgi:hypothetical protein
MKYPDPNKETMDNYYLIHEKRIMREIKMAIPHFRRFGVDAYGTQLAGSVVDDTLKRFAALLPQIPYIGGDANRLTENLYLSAAMLAFYQALKVHGKPVEEISRIIYLGTVSFYSSFPIKAMLWWEGRNIFSHRRLEKLQQKAVVSQARQYPGNWVYNYVPGNGKSFLFGVDYIDCGIVKYLNDQGAAELAPYLCWLDYPMCASMQVGLVRTITLAQGGNKCDFRFCRWQAGTEIVPDFMKN